MLIKRFSKIASAISFLLVYATAPLTAAASGVFVYDEGESCAIYVSMDEDQAVSALGSVDVLKAQLVSNILADSSVECPFSALEEIGLITVASLDEYNQPDWGEAIEHAYFSVKDWDAVVADCDDVASENCASAAQQNLSVIE